MSVSRQAKLNIAAVVFWLLIGGGYFLYDSYHSAPAPIAALDIATNTPILSPTETVLPTSTSVPFTATPDQLVLDPIVTPTASPTLPTLTPVPASPTVTPSPVSVAAVVNVDTLNLRSGPTTDNLILAQVHLEDELRVLGQSGGCAWLTIIAPQGLTGWVAGEYVTLDVPCDSIPPMSPTPTLTSPSAPIDTPTPSSPSP